jgi:hypothetical protein
VIRWSFLPFVIYVLGCEKARSHPAPGDTTPLRSAEASPMPPSASGSGSGGAPLVPPASWRYPRGPGYPPEPAAQPPPTYKLFFDEVWLELIDLPRVSDQVLSKTQGGFRVTPPKYAEYEVGQMSRVNPYLSPPLAPPSGTPHVAFPMENGCCDVIRARYRASSYFIDLAYARYLFSVRVAGDVRQPGESPLDAAIRTVAFLFDRNDSGWKPIYFIQVNDADGTDVAAPAYGCHDVSRASYSADSPHWVDLLCWWVRQQEIGFISMLGEGEPSRAVKSADAEANRRWFSPIKK